MITKKTIQRQIEELEYEIMWHREQITHLCDAAKNHGFLVYKDDDYAAVYYKDYTQESFISNDLARMKGTTKGLQIAIDQLKTLL